MKALEPQAIDCKVLQRQLKIKNINDVYLPSEDCTPLEDDSESGFFYHCGLGGAVKQPCGAGTIFSLRNKDCRRPINTKCITLEKYLEKKNVKLEDFYNEDY